MVETTVRLHTGHLQIHGQGFLKRNAIETMIKNPGPVEEALGAMEDVVSFSPRVVLKGLASTAENSIGVKVYGIEPEAESRVTMISQKIIKGRYLASGDTRAAVIGIELAEDLEAEIGSKVVIMAQSLDGTLGAELVRVRGIFRTGSPSFDRAIVYVMIDDAKRLLGIGDAVHEFAVIAGAGGSAAGGSGGVGGFGVRASGLESVDTIKERLLARPDFEGLEVVDWKEITPMLVQMMEAKRVGLMIVLAIVFAIVALGIVNTMLMAVMERIKEFGLMKSLGARPVHLVALILTEAFFLGLLGLVFGLTLGFSVVYYFSVYGIDLTSFSDALSNLLPGEAVMYPGFSPRYTVISSIAIVIISVVASIYPAVKAARLRPVDALRHI